jgi:hypothetical protein
VSHNHSSPCLHDRQYGAPDEVVRCKCGKDEPIPGDDHCEACEIAFFLAQPEEFDDACDHGYGQTPATARVVSAVASERVRRFGEQVPVYRRTA